MKKLKNFSRALLAFGCLLYVILFARDFEILAEYERMGLYVNDAKTWFWLFYAGLMPLIALGFASVYAFSKYLFKKRWMLTVAVAVMGVFLAFSELLHVNEEYDALPAVVSLLAAGIYIACIYAPKVPHRRAIAATSMAVLMVGQWLVCGISMGLQNQDLSVAFRAVYVWSVCYTAPLIPLALLGLILPEKYD